MLLGNRLCAGLLVLATSSVSPCQAQMNIATSQPAESSANIEKLPPRILKTGITLNTDGISPNSLQLANNIGLTALLENIHSLRARVNSLNTTPSLESLDARQNLAEEVQRSYLLIQKTDLEVDFTLSEIENEYQHCQEILATFTNDRDKAIARMNALSFISNGALWAVTEALAIPTYKNAKFAIPSGIIGIPAGLVPSVASMWTLKQLKGKKMTSDVDPNMLAKLFNYPGNSEVDYPRSVWTFLHQVPASESNGKTRLAQLTDRWIADANMPGFTDRSSKKQLGVLTGSVAQRKGLSIDSLTARTIMLDQLACEILKMKRMLLELAMVVQGEKQMTASAPHAEGRLPQIGMH
ncbi:MAG: hypothetical protein K2Y22_08420 [Candidatus Obscuribacterales bacterium]|nr:hypothetical protein [Candidatus Obscuribacterales bacterium]